MKTTLLFLATTASVFAQTKVNFDEGATLPAEWKSGITGGGDANWEVVRDADAPSAPHVLKQSGEATFCWAAKTSLRVKGMTSGYGLDAKVAKNKWNVLRVDFAGALLTVSLNGSKLFDVEDTTIQGAGAVGVWTKADSVTLFDDFTYGNN